VYVTGFELVAECVKKIGGVYLYCLSRVSVIFGNPKSETYGQHHFFIFRRRLLRTGATNHFLSCLLRMH